ncbi:amphi-Trp domain-containing protein [Streptomyces sp. SID5770]|uniref:amphi-Trp domain-containing protein n=2 Tax=Streptomyces TaxID=1883 RepID=UPI0013679D17|nr:amphi-Trp domain-containing protein [Streptomyces sp. SID5770]MZE51731.1 amphi-Trp domain-containing protein [Streptomyces sp. SID5770]
MKDLTFEQKRPVSRLEAAEQLMELATALKEGGEVEWNIGHGTLSLRVPDELHSEIEVEIGEGRVELEIELEWSTARHRPAPPKPPAGAEEKEAKTARRKSVSPKPKPKRASTSTGTRRTASAKRSAATSCIPHAGARTTPRCCNGRRRATRPDARGRRARRASGTDHHPTRSRHERR